MIRRSDIYAVTSWAFALAVICYVSTFGQVVLNGTHSLPHNAYFMVTWPKSITHGSYVTFAPPAVFHDAFDESRFVKRVHGLPGDAIVNENGSVCVKDACRALQPSLIAKGYPALATNAVPENHVLVFGDSADSLDSRYQIVGTIPQEEIEAVGWPLRFPHWKEIAEWLG